MNKIIQQIDTYLRLNKPETWSLRLHIVLPLIGIAAILFTFIGCLENPINYNKNDFPIALTLGYLVIITGLVFWLAFVFRFNIWKSFGKVKKGSGIIHFFLVWVTFFTAISSPMCLYFGRHIRTTLTYSNTELVKDINDFNQLNASLDLVPIGNKISVNEYNDDSLNNNLSYTNKIIELSNELKLNEIPQSGFLILNEDSLVFFRKELSVFSFSNYTVAKFGLSAPDKYLKLCNSGRFIFNTLKTNGRPWVSLPLNPILKSTNPWNKPLNQVSNFYKLVIKYNNNSSITEQDILNYTEDPIFKDYRDENSEYKNFDEPSETIETKQLQEFNDKYTKNQIDSILDIAFFVKPPIYFEKREYELDNFNQFKSFEYNINVSTKINNTTNNLNEIAEYKHWFNLSKHTDFALIWLYTSLALTMVYFIFRHVTIKTFGITILSGVILSALFGILIGLFSLINYNNLNGNIIAKFSGILFFVYVGLFLVLALQILKAKKRSIFHGIGLNLFFVSFPLVPLVYYLVFIQNSASNNFETNYLFIIQIIIVIAIIISIEPIHRLYLKWYALPEE